VAELAERECVPCKGGVPPLEGEELARLTEELGGDWLVPDGRRLEKEFDFPDFAAALSFVDAVGALAEEQGHHPDIYLAWGKAGISLWTHKINGLTESDFILAARIDRIER